MPLKKSLELLKQGGCNPPPTRIRPCLTSCFRFHTSDCTAKEEDHQHTEKNSPASQMGLEQANASTNSCFPLIHLGSVYCSLAVTHSSYISHLHTHSLTTTHSVFSCPYMYALHPLCMHNMTAWLPPAAPFLLYMQCVHCTMYIHMLHTLTTEDLFQ